MLPLLPAERQGTFQAVLVPTRPGVYTFHVMGTVKKRPINATSTCSEATFECVVDASDVQFPAKEPSSGQLADRIERALPRAERAVETADDSRRLALAGAVFAVLALITPPAEPQSATSLARNRRVTWEFCVRQTGST